MQIRQRIALDRNRRRRIRESGGSLRIYALGMIGKIGVEASFADFFFIQIAGQLVYHGSHDLQMPKLLHADVGQQPFDLFMRHGKTLTEIAQRRRQFAVGAPVLADDGRRHARIGIFDFDRILKLLFIHKHA